MEWICSLRGGAHSKNSEKNPCLGAVCLDGLVAGLRVSVELELCVCHVETPEEEVSSIKMICLSVVKSELRRFDGTAVIRQ